MVYYSTSCGNLSGWKGIRASDVASVKLRNKISNSPCAKCPNYEVDEFRGYCTIGVENCDQVPDEEEWEEMDEEERRKYNG